VIYASKGSSDKDALVNDCLFSILVDESHDISLSSTFLILYLMFLGMMDVLLDKHSKILVWLLTWSHFVGIYCLKELKLFVYGCQEEDEEIISLKIIFILASLTEIYLEDFSFDDRKDTIFFLV
ncbi:hypothetical protein ACJX0J_029023, partial [Zea mays]